MLGFRVGLGLGVGFTLGVGLILGLERELGLRLGVVLGLGLASSSLREAATIGAATSELCETVGRLRVLSGSTGGLGLPLPTTFLAGAL